MSNHSHNRTRFSRGLSIVEVLVATALFSVVMIVGIGSIVSLNDSNKKAHLTRTVMDNLNFAMENIARNLRVGSAYHCDVTSPPVTTVLDCSNGASSIAFEGYKGDPTNSADQLVYRLNATTHQIERSIDSGGAYLPITSPELSVDLLTFYVTGTAFGDGRQPRVIISITGSAIFKQGIRSDFKIQTAVSQRRLDS